MNRSEQIKVGAWRALDVPSFGRLVSTGKQKQPGAAATLVVGGLWSWGHSRTRRAGDMK